MVLSVILYACTKRNVDVQIVNYVDTHCNFGAVDSCYIDLKEIFNLNYDEMYLFSGYDLSESVPFIVEGQPIILHGGYIYGTEMDMVVLARNHKIITKKKWKHNKVFLSKGVLIEKKGIFDGDSLIVTAHLYTSSIFRVIRNKDLTYFLKPIQ
jgi:hypothetical protein